jgi:hypothetical protein
VKAQADRWIKWTTTGCVGLLALIAGTVSYLHMHMLVERHGQPGWVAALTPLSVDGMISRYTPGLRLRRMISATASGLCRANAREVAASRLFSRSAATLINSPISSSHSGYSGAECPFTGLA